MTRRQAYTYSNEGPQCPHCGRQFVADDSSYYDEFRYTRDECDECGKPFSVSVYTSTSWTCEPLDAEESAQSHSKGEDAA